MPEQIQVNKSLIRLEIGDITEQEVDAFVYYARHDLALGSGFGGAIAVRGGPAIADELKKLGPLETTEAVLSSAGNLKARHIIHAVGPRFQEDDLERKLRKTMGNILALADKKGLSRLALPPLGTGFYGVPLDLCAKIMYASLKEYLSGPTAIREVIICLNDRREYQPFAKHLSLLAQTREVSI